MLFNWAQDPCVHSCNIFCSKSSICALEITYVVAGNWALELSELYNISLKLDRPFSEKAILLEMALKKKNVLNNTVHISKIGPCAWNGFSLSFWKIRTVFSY